MKDRDDLAEGMRDVLERYPRFRQAMMEADVWWEGDRCIVHFVGPDHPELRAGAVALGEALGTPLEHISPDAPPMELPSGPPVGWGGRPRAASEPRAED